MSDIFVPSDLKTRFSRFGVAAGLVDQLVGHLDRIGQDNRDAAGTTDQIALAYHGQVSVPTQNLSVLVGDIAVALGLTGESGSAVASGFASGETDAGQHARRF